MSQIAICVLQRLLHQHVEHVWYFVHLIVHSTSMVGMTYGVSKIDQFKVLVIPFFLHALHVSDGKNFCCNRLLRLIARSFNQLYSSAWKCVYFCGWITSWTCCCDASNSNFFKASCDYSWHLLEITILDFFLINRLLKKILKLNI